MKRAIDDKLYQIQRGLPMQRDIWELYGATRLRAQELLDRAEALQRESNATTGSRPTPPPYLSSTWLSEVIGDARGPLTFCLTWRRQDEGG